MKKIIITDAAPAPIGPYNQAVLINNVLYTSGQIAINNKLNEIITHNIEAETLQVMENLKAILTAADMTFDNVVKSTIFITDMNNFSAINAVYSQFFNEETAPARETVQVTALPKMVNIEISMIAVK